MSVSGIRDSPICLGVFPTFIALGVKKIYIDLTVYCLGFFCHYRPAIYLGTTCIKIRIKKRASARFILTMLLQ